MGIFGFFTEKFIEQSSVFKLIFSKSLNLTGCQSDKIRNFSQNIQKISRSPQKKNIRGMKLILFIHDNLILASM